MGVDDHSAYYLIQYQHREIWFNLLIQYNVFVSIVLGRAGGSEYAIDQCSWRFNRMLAHEAHKQGFAVLEREEIERRLLFKAEHYVPTRNMKPNLHLENPSPNIVATALLTLISCLKKNESSTFIQVKSSSLSSQPVSRSNDLSWAVALRQCQETWHSCPRGRFAYVRPCVQQRDYTDKTWRGAACPYAGCPDCSRQAQYDQRGQNYTDCHDLS